MCRTHPWLLLWLVVLATNAFNPTAVLASRPQRQQLRRRVCADARGAASAHRRGAPLRADDAPNNLAEGAEDAPNLTKDPTNLAKGARNLSLWLVLLAVEPALRIPAYSECVAAKGHDACADLLPLVDWLYQHGLSPI